jgi:hypothetical protein
VGAAVWAGGAEPYQRTVAAAANAAIRLFEAPAVTRLRAEKREVIVDREDFPETSARPGIPADDLDFNVAILAALFAASPRALSDRGIRRFAAAAGLLWITHVVALVFAVESLYALSLGPWSAARYGPIARNFWATGSHFYRIAGIFAVPFALWWALAAAPAGAEPRAGGRRAR